MKVVCFDFVEPDYKLSLDIKKREYVKVTVRSEKAAAGETEEPISTNEPIAESEDTTISNQAEVTPNDQGFQSQYYLKDISATKAWRTTVGEEILIGVLDTGVEADHPDLIGKIRSGSDSLDLVDGIGHGTAVSGIIAANTNNSEGIAGVSWNTRIVARKITDDFGQARASTVVQALDDLYKKGVKVVHISLSTNQFSRILRDGIKEAQDRGMLIVSTSGNTGVEEVRYPAGFQNVIGVGAVDKFKSLETYSTIGGHVSLVAPGSSIYTTDKDAGYNKVTGTSFAAPQVTGAAALVWSIAPELTSDDVREILMNSADDLGMQGQDIEYGHGLLNIEKAVQLAKAKN